MPDTAITRFCANETASLKALAQTDPGIMQAVAEHADAQSPSLDLNSVAEAIAHDAGLDEEAVSSVLSALWPLAMTQRRFDMDTETFVAGLEECLGTEERVHWSKEDRAGWDVVRPHITRLLDDDSSVASSAKAVDLLLEQSLLLCRSRIVTDMRPIFNDAADQLKGMLPFHTLILRCHEGTATNRQIHIALDASDLTILREQVLRAQQKEQFMRKSLSTAGFVIVDTGMDENIDGEING